MTDEHGIDVESDAEVDTAEDDEREADVDPTPEKETGDESEKRADEAADQENLDNHRDEEPFEG